jgi:hypothetical protein
MILDVTQRDHNDNFHAAVLVQNDENDRKDNYDANKDEGIQHSATKSLAR